MVRMFTASPSASPPRILPPASNQSCAQAASSPRASAGSPSSRRLLAFLGSARGLISREQILSFHGRLKLIQWTQKIEVELAGKSDLKKAFNMKISITNVTKTFIV